MEVLFKGLMGCWSSLGRSDVSVASVQLKNEKDLFSWKVQLLCSLEMLSFRRELMSILWMQIQELQEVSLNRKVQLRRFARSIWNCLCSRLQDANQTWYTNKCRNSCTTTYGRRQTRGRELQLIQPADGASNRRKQASGCSYCSHSCFLGMMLFFLPKRCEVVEKIKWSVMLYKRGNPWGSLASMTKSSWIVFYFRAFYFFYLIYHF